MATETLIHIDDELSPEQRDLLAAALTGHGGQCDGRFRSTKPHLVFVDYDAARTSPTALLETVRAAGYSAQLVDL